MSTTKSFDNPTWWSGQTAATGVTISALNTDGTPSQGFSLDATPIQVATSSFAGITALPASADSPVTTTLSLVNFSSSSLKLGYIGTLSGTAPYSIPIGSVIVLKASDASTDIFGSNYLYNTADFYKDANLGNYFDLTNGTAKTGAVILSSPYSITFAEGQFRFVSGAAAPSSIKSYELSASGITCVAQVSAAPSVSLGVFVNGTELFPEYKGLSVVGSNYVYSSLFALQGEVTLSPSGLQQTVVNRFDVLSSFKDIPSWLVNAINNGNEIVSSDLSARVKKLELKTAFQSTILSQFDA